MWDLVIKDNLKACIPGKQLLRRLSRRLVSYESLSANDDLAFGQGLELLGLIGRYGIGTGTVLEVGTGWIPTIPHILKAHGAERLILTDVEYLIDPNTFRYARQFVGGRLAEIAAVSGFDEAVLADNLARPDVHDYRCPPRLEQIPDGSVDLICSRTVLEHIAPDLLRGLLGEWRRLLRPGGHCVHFVDNSDHFEHRDKSLSRLNFLTLDGAAWKFASFNPQNYQNRLRHSDYLRLFADAGYEILHAEGDPDPKTLAALETLPIVDRFRAYAPDDLAVLTTVIVARSPGP